MSAGIDELRPTQTRAIGVSGPRTRRTAALPTRASAAPAAMLPTPATMGTSPRRRASCPSSREKVDWIVGMRVTSAAKHSPWAA